MKIDLKESTPWNQPRDTYNMLIQRADQNVIMMIRHDAFHTFVQFN